MSEVRLSRDAYQKVNVLTLVNMRSRYVRLHDFTVDGYMSALESLVGSLEDRSAPVELVNISIDSAIRHAYDVREASDRYHSTQVRRGSCPVCSQ